MTQTVYRPVPDHVDLYAGIDGSIVRAEYGELKQKIGPKGYWYVYIPMVGTKETHTLIAAAFLGPRPSGRQVRHSDSDKTNNSVENLCYGTPKDNTQDAILNGKHGSVTNKSKTECPQGHAYESAYIVPANGWRQCPICRANQVRKTEEKQRHNSKASSRGLTIDQKRTMAYGLLNDTSLSDREIARQTGITHTTVARYRRNTAPTKEG